MQATMKKFNFIPAKTSTDLNNTVWVFALERWLEEEDGITGQKQSLPRRL